MSGHTDVQLAGAVILGVSITHMNREGQRSDAHSRISYVAVKQDCNMLNGKQYLQICDINKFEAQTGPHLFSQYSHFTRRGRA